MDTILLNLEPGITLMYINGYNSSQLRARYYTYIKLTGCLFVIGLSKGRFITILGEAGYLYHLKITRLWKKKYSPN